MQTIPPCLIVIDYYLLVITPGYYIRLLCKSLKSKGCLELKPEGMELELKLCPKLSTRSPLKTLLYLRPTPNILSSKTKQHGKIMCNGFVKINIYDDDTGTKECFNGHNSVASVRLLDP